jgi:hypothetical protein
LSFTSQRAPTCLRFHRLEISGKEHKAKELVYISAQLSELDILGDLFLEGLACHEGLEVVVDIG